MKDNSHGQSELTLEGGATLTVARDITFGGQTTIESAFAGRNIITNPDGSVTVL